MCLYYLYRFACAIRSVITIEGVIMFLQDFTSHMPRQHMKAGRLSPGKEICELKKKKSGIKYCIILAIDFIYWQRMEFYVTYLPGYYMQQLK